jgi:phage-related protein
MIINTIVALWNNVFKPIWDVAWPLMWANVKATFTTVWNVIVGVFSGMLDIIKGIFEVFSGVITGNWTKVWTGLKDILKGIINSILSMVEGMVNGVIDAINGIIRSINAVGKHTGINIGEVPRLSIPKLAEGGIITAPTIALIGEAGDEAVVPLDQYNKGNNQTIIVKIGEDTIAEKVIEAINNRSSQMGYNLLTV